MTYDFNNGMGEDPQYKDKADYFGSEDASLEMGVIAVAAMVIAWLFFSWALPWVVTASLLILAYRVFRGQTTIPALWERIRLLPGKLAHVFRSTKIVFEIRRVPEDVLDVTLLRDSLFAMPPQSVEHQQTRDAFVRVAAMKPIFGVSPDSDDYKERNRYMLLLASTIAQLEYWGDDPIGPIRERRWKPPTAPKALPAPTMQPLAGVQGIGALPIPGVGWLSQYLMVALVLVGGFAFWQFDRANDNAAKAKTARADARMWQDAHKETFENAQAHARKRDEEFAITRAEAEKSRALAEREQGRAARLAALRKRENDEALRGAPVDVRSSLRELAEPAAAAEPPPAGTGTGDSPG